MGVSSSLLFFSEAIDRLQTTRLRRGETPRRRRMNPRPSSSAACRILPRPPVVRPAPPAEPSSEATLGARRNAPPTAFRSHLDHLLELLDRQDDAVDRPPAPLAHEPQHRGRRGRAELAVVVERLVVRRELGEERLGDRLRWWCVARGGGAGANAMRRFAWSGFCGSEDSERRLTRERRASRTGPA